MKVAAPAARSGRAHADENNSAVDCRIRYNLSSAGHDVHGLAESRPLAKPPPVQEPAMHDEFSKIEDAIQALREGRIIIVVDDEDRENEGDFVAAAEKVTPETVEFMITHGRGLLCMPILPEVAARLQLGPMVDRNTAPHQTPYTVPVDHSSCRTGISAEERARTVRRDHRPGHQARRLGPSRPSVSPGRQGRGRAPPRRAYRGDRGPGPAGRLDARRHPVRDTRRHQVAGREKLHEIAREHGLPIVSIEALIKYRRLREKLVHRVAEADLPTRYGRGRIIGYRVQHEPGNEPVAFVMGDLRSVEAPLVRLHSSCFTGDLLDSLRCDCGDQLHMALAMIGDEGAGALIYLPQEGRGIGLIEKIRAYNLQDKGLDTVEANTALGYRADPRDYGIGLQILKDLGLSRVRLLTNNPKKTDAFVYYGYDLKVVDQVPIIAPELAERRRYLETKARQAGPPASILSRQ